MKDYICSIYLYKVCHTCNHLFVAASIMPALTQLPINHHLYDAMLEKICCIKLGIFPDPSVLTSVFGAQKNRLIETALLSTNNICFG